MSELRAIRIERGPQGFGGPLIIRPTEQKNKVMYITGGGTAPECLKKIVELSGMTPVDGFHGSAPEEELAMVIVDCGGTLRCGIYPQKRIPTVNVMPVDKSGSTLLILLQKIFMYLQLLLNRFLLQKRERQCRLQKFPRKKKKKQ